MIKTIVNGAIGRMGQTIIRLAAKDSQLKIVGAVDSSDCQFLGTDAGEHVGVGNIGVKITDTFSEIIEKADLIIDFSSPEGTQKALSVAGPTGKAVVVGTTGHTEEQRKTFSRLSKEIPLLISPNMCVGVNLLWKLSQIAAKTLGKDYQINIVERHHIHKKDAPSGTAKRLIEIVTDATGHDITEDVFYSMDGASALVIDKPISVKSVREGEVVGDHSLYFTSKGDRIELSHFAFTREIFAQGAIRAAKWIVDKPAGLYDMHDVLF